MAMYSCTIRSNYFRVKDPDSFRLFMSRVYGTKDSVSLFEEKAVDGSLMFGFGTYGGIGGIRDDAASGDDECAADETGYDDFIAGLQSHIADGDAVIILEAGNEKLRYVVGQATIVTSQDYDVLSIRELAIARAAAMLDKPGWNTKCEY